ncbi:hypothetical protein BJV74DRAFT_831673 [Russula compacta]|nr:hypothetical protein BJV74DRAFT_831673 [Russula compacta]
MASLSVPPSTGPTPTRLDWANTPEHRQVPAEVTVVEGARGTTWGHLLARGEESWLPSNREGHKYTNSRPSSNSASPFNGVSPFTYFYYKQEFFFASQPPPGVGVDLKEKRKAGPRRAPQHAEDKLPSLTIQPASPTAINTPPPITQQAFRATISSENLTVESLTSAMKARKSSSGPSSPRPKDSVSKNAPHTLPSIASADPNPSTTESTEKAQLELMSPILDDSLKQLPHGFDKTTPSPSVGSGSLSPNIANQAPVLAVNGELDDEDAAGVAGALSSSSPVGSDQPEDQSPGLSEPSPQSGPVSSPPPERVLASNTGPPRDTPPHLAGPSSEDSAPASSVTPLIQSGRSLADSIHAPHRAAHAPSEAHATQSEVDISIGVSAESVHASAPKSDESESGPPEGPRSAPLPRAPMHGRSHTLGAHRHSPPVPSAGVGVTAAKGPHHGRTQSSPVTHRRQQSRPVITMDAMTRLAKTLGTALPKREVAGTSSATSSE